MAFDHVSIEWNRERFQQSFNVSRETMEKMDLYGAALKQWQNSINLVSAASLDDIWCRHMADSAQLAEITRIEELGDAGKPVVWLDLGSGAGFPGLVMAILSREFANLEFHLVESKTKKCAFLREVARKTNVKVEIHNCRIEAINCSNIVDNVVILSARALAPLSELLPYAEPLISSVSRCLFHKGQEFRREVAVAKEMWAFDHEMHASLTDRRGVILDITNLKRK